MKKFCSLKTLLLCFCILNLLIILIHIFLVPTVVKSAKTILPVSVRDDHVKLLSNKEMSNLEESKEQQSSRTPVTYIVIPYYLHDNRILYTNFIQNLRKNDNIHKNLKILLIQSIDRYKLKDGFLLNVGILQGLKNSSTQCIMTYDLNVVLPENIDFLSCKLPTSMCSSFKCGKSYTNSINVIQASKEHWQKINGYTNKATASEDITFDLFQRINTAGLFKPNMKFKAMLANTCICIDPKIYYNKAKMYRANQPQDFEDDGLNSAQYYITESAEDKYGSTWINVKDISKVSKSEIYQIKRELYTAPIVISRYKFIFFWSEKSGCTYWKRVLQFILGIKMLPTESNVHHAFKNGLLHLGTFHDNEIHKLIHDDSWLKVAFVREPRERILSAFLDKGLDDHFMQYFCKQTVKTFTEFVHLIKQCKNRHWESQVRAPKYYYNKMMIGYMNETADFTEKLLRKVGAWNEDIKIWLNSQNISKSTRPHARNAKEKLRKHYTKDLENIIFEMYSEEYETFGFKKEFYN